ncbi:MAG: DNA primase [bacterium]|nr:DNA primase [bacterium]
MLDDSTVEAVKAYPDIVSVMSHYMTLKKRGRSFVGLCPFHSEKSPSFHVSAEKRLFHCFGCHESGDLIAFVMKMDNLGFVDSVKSIAKRVGIEVIENEGSYGNSTRDLELEAVQGVLFEARELFSRQLERVDGMMDYIKSRGVTQDSIHAFHLGAAPSNNAIHAYFKERAYDEDLLVKSGLFYKADSGHLRCPFAGRLMFPILNHVGKTLGFGGRKLNDDEPGGKYINSVDSAYFNKGRILYGMDVAKGAIRKSKQVVIVEGYMDVIMCHQYGFKNVVASMGTALTPMQVQLIKRYADEVVLAMDSDEAGKNAVERSYHVLNGAALAIKIVQLPDKDPADLLVKGGADAYVSVLDGAQHIVEVMMDRFLQGIDTNNIGQVSKVVNDITPFLLGEQDPLLRNHFVAYVASKLKVDKEILLARIQKTRYTKGKKIVQPLPKTKTKYEKAEDFLIYITASNLEIRAEVANSLEASDIVSPSHRTLYSAICSSGSVNHELIESLNDGESKTLLSRVLMDGEKLKNTRLDATQWKDCVDTLRGFKRDQRLREIRHLLASKDSVNEQDEDALLVELNELMAQH